MKKKTFKIDFINSGYRRYFNAHRKEVMSAIEQCFDKGNFTLREDVEKFEQNLCDFTGAKYAVGVNSGTDALKVAYKACGLKPGDEVITVSHTFIAPIEEIVHLGGVPILVDVGDDGLMDVDLIEKAITDRTVGIVPVHLSGKVCDMSAIMRIAKKYRLWVVEDACQALGAYHKKKMAGTFGAFGCFSFISPKTLGGAGDAGGLISNNRQLAIQASLLRNHWNITQGALHGHQPKTPKVMDWGYNTRLDNIQAAVLNVKWKYYPKMLEKRREIGMMYNEGLRGLPIELPIQQEQQIYQEYIVGVPDMWEFQKFMTSKGIELLIRDVTPNHKLPGLKMEHFNLPVTERMATAAVRLPTYPELEKKEVQEIIKAIQEFYAK